MAKQYIPLVTKCSIAAGNKHAGNLLYRIHYWMQHAKITFGGKKFCANSASWWCAEADLSDAQYRRAIARLRKLGLVETEQHLFGRRNITHVRITDVGLAAIQSALPSSNSSALDDPANSAQPKVSKCAQLLLKGESTLEILKGDSKLTLADANVAPGKSDLEKVPGEKKEDLDEEYKAENIKNSHPLAQNDFTPNGLAIIWRETVLKEAPGYIAPKTAKELGQWKGFLKQSPPGQAAKIARFCVHHWTLFTMTVKGSAGLFNVPGSPHVGFLVKYVGEAATFYMKNTLQDAVGAPEPKQSSKPQLGSAKQLKEDQEPELTYDEFMALIAEDFEG